MLNTKMAAYNLHLCQQPIMRFENPPQEDKFMPNVHLLQGDYTELFNLSELSDPLSECVI